MRSSLKRAWSSSTSRATRGISVRLFDLVIVTRTQLSSACDGDTKSEIVIPLTVSINGEKRTIGVFDLDSTVNGTFDDEDLRGLTRIVEIVAGGSDWA